MGSSPGVYFTQQQTYDVPAAAVLRVEPGPGVTGLLRNGGTAGDAFDSVDWGWANFGTRLGDALPLVGVCAASLTVAVTVSITLAAPDKSNLFYTERAQQNKILPYLSDTGADAPQSIVFAVGLGVAALLFGAAFLHIQGGIARRLQQHVVRAAELKVPPPAWCGCCCAVGWSLNHLNRVACVSGLGSAVCLAALAAVNLNVDAGWHTGFAVFFFVFGYIHLVALALLSHCLRRWPHADMSPIEHRAARWRAACFFLALALFVTTLALYIVSWQLDGGDTYYRFYGAVTQWLGVIILMTYFLSFVPAAGGDAGPPSAASVRRFLARQERNRRLMDLAGALAAATRKGGATGGKRRPPSETMGTKKASKARRVMIPAPAAPALAPVPEMMSTHDVETANSLTGDWSLSQWPALAPPPPHAEGTKVVRRFIARLPAHQRAPVHPSAGPPLAPPPPPQVISRPGSATGGPHARDKRMGEPLSAGGDDGGRAPWAVGPYPVESAVRPPPPPPEASPQAVNAGVSPIPGASSVSLAKPSRQEVEHEPGSPPWRTIQARTPPHGSPLRDASPGAAAVTPPRLLSTDRVYFWPSGGSAVPGFAHPATDLPPPVPSPGGDTLRPLPSHGGLRNSPPGKNDRLVPVFM